MASKVEAVASNLIDLALAGIKAVRSGGMSAAALSETLKQLDATQMLIVAELSRTKLSILNGIRDIKSLI